MLLYGKASYPHHYSYFAVFPLFLEIGTGSLNKITNGLNFEIVFLQLNSLL